MATTTFVDKETPIEASWLNEIDAYVYGTATFPVERNGAVGDGVTDDTTAIQAAIDAAEAANGGTVLLMEKHVTSSTLTIDSECVALVGRGAVFQKSTEKGTQIEYSGAGVGILVNGVDGIRLKDFRIESTISGGGTSGIHVVDAQQCLFENVKVREFKTDGWLLECTTAKSTIYNTWINCSGLRSTTKVANGLRMLEAAGKAVNNNVFINCDFGSNLVGIQQDSDCNDNSFIGVEGDGCTTCAVIRGRTHFSWANFENATTGLNVVSGSSAVVSGSIHFGGNGTDISNTGNRPIPAILHGGTTSAGGWNATGSGYGFRGATAPTAGGFNFSTDDGDPALQRGGTSHFNLESGTTRFNRSAYIPSGQSLTFNSGSSFIHSTAAGITADVGSSQGDGALTSVINEIATCANAGDAVTLPTAVAGLKITIINNGANACDVFPASSDNLGAGVDTAASLAAGSNITYAAYDATNWKSV